MTTVKEVDQSAVNGTQGDLPAQEVPDSDRPDRTPPARRHVEALLDISEEDFLEELEPYEYHCYAGWEEAVRGWARVAPLSSILLPQRIERKAKSEKRKEANNHSPIADTLVDVAAEHCSESQLGPPNSSKKSVLLSQQKWSRGKSAASFLQPDVPVSPVLGAMPKILSHFTQEDKTEEDETLRQQHHLSAKYNVLDNRPSKPQKQQKSSNTVPIKNFTFLPPIKTPHMNFQRVSGQTCTGRKHLEGDPMAENYYIFDRMSGIKGSNSELPKDTNNAVTSMYRTCQHNPHFFSAVSVSVPKMYQVAVSSKPETLHPNSYSVGNNLHSGTAGSAQVHMHPSCLFS